jgi:hypothetical protein
MDDETRAALTEKPAASNAGPGRMTQEQRDGDR